MAATIRFAINRTCAPHLPLADFIALAQKVGVEAVEIRNDIEGQEFANGMPAGDLKARLDGAGLRIASVNALQRFNDWTSARAEEARSLIAYAAALGAPGLVLCPAHLPGDDSHPDAHRRLCEGLTELQPLLQDAELIGYVEPLGMRHSSMPYQRQAIAAIDQMGAGAPFQLCYDTFQHFRASDDALFADLIGLVHVSGITRADLAPPDLTEPDRGFVFDADRVGNAARLGAMIRAGYRGFVSMEPFSPQTQRDPLIADRLAASLAYLRHVAGIG